MSKIGVGVGEEFPLDEEARANSSQEEVADDDRCCGHSHDARRKAWQAFRHQMHAEWHARRRAFHDRFNRCDGGEAIHDRHLHHLIIGGLAMIGLAALFSVLHHRD